MRILNILAITCLALAATPALAGPTTERPQQAAPPAGFDAAATSSEQEVDVGPLALRLKQRHADRLAGVYVEPERNRLVFRLTGDEPVPAETHRVDGERVDVVFQTGAEHTFAQLMAVMEGEHATIDRLLPGAHGRYVDERTGEIVIGVEPGKRPDAAQLTEALGVPVRVETEEPAILNQVQAAPAPRQ